MTSTKVTTAPSAASSENVEVRGLQHPAEIVIDRWGIPHIRAETLDDLFFAQGYNAARDRLWQIDLWRKRGLGQLAGDLGPGFLAQDRASRLFIYRGDMAAEWASYSTDAEAICTAFVTGLNAYVDLIAREPERLPPEFTLSGTKPARWQPDDVVRIRSHALTRNALSEVLRANVSAQASATTDLLRKRIEPPVTPHRADDLDLASIPLDVLDTFRLATASVTCPPARLAASLREVEAWTKVNELGDVLQDAMWQGSNNWAVKGSRTETGRPILATDPHRNHSVPSLRYLVHLTAPGFDAIGAGEPAVPGITIGHNGRIAFGLTIFGADQEDVYVYETDPEDPDRYRYGEGWERMRCIEERFSVRGCPDQTATLKYTRHGPVLFEDRAKRRAYAVRSVWFEPGSAAYLASLGAMRARSFAEFRTAMRRWGTPSVNQLYADVEGTIAWLGVGYTPIRPNWNGLLPVPGDGRYEWAGFLDPDLQPCIVDPPTGFLATANEMNLPADWPHDDQPIGFEWIESSRATRITEALAADPSHGVLASCALQTDVLSIPARRIGKLCSELNACEELAIRGLALLSGWDYRLSVESAAAALFEVWWTKHLKPAVLRWFAPDEDVRKMLVPGDVERILTVLEQVDSSSQGLSRAERDELLLGSLVSAMRECRARMGEDQTGWAWGRLHHGYFEHAFSGLADDARVLNIGPLPKGGSGSTPMHTGYRPSDFRIVAGASVRIVMDVGDWDRSMCINAPGQSGDRRTSHYRDLAPIWAAGEYVPMLYSAPAVDSAAEFRVRLMPTAEGRGRISTADAPAL